MKIELDEGDAILVIDLLQKEVIQLNRNMIKSPDSAERFMAKRILEGYERTLDTLQKSFFN